jgi:hypothetical protein
LMLEHPVAQRDQHQLNHGPAGGTRLRPMAPPGRRWRTTLRPPGLCPRIRVSAIAPGSILTSALDVVAGDGLRKPMEKATPCAALAIPTTRRCGSALASPAGSFLTGKHWRSTAASPSQPRHPRRRMREQRKSPDAVRGRFCVCSRRYLP